VNCWDISGVEGVSQCYFYCGFLLLWVKVGCGERLRIYSGKLFIAIKSYYHHIQLLKQSSCSIF
jgi:hypothetical protein